MPSLFIPVAAITGYIPAGQQLNTQFTRPFPPCGSGLACETTKEGPDQNVAFGQCLDNQQKLP